VKEEEAFERAASSPPADGEEEGDAGTGGAFNPETGEINWDCPCLGGMAYGPCGEQFREAFSCFVFSEDEPKGINCVEKFKAMQDCFRAHPETYGEEILRDEEEEDAVAGADPKSESHAASDLAIPESSGSSPPSITAPLP